MALNDTPILRLGGVFWNGGAETFAHEGPNGRWRDMLPAADNAAYEARAVAELGKACSNWLVTGQASLKMSKGRDNEQFK